MSCSQPLSTVLELQSDRNPSGQILFCKPLTGGLLNVCTLCILTLLVCSYSLSTGLLLQVHDREQIALTGFTIVDFQILAFWILEMCIFRLHVLEQSVDMRFLNEN